MLTGNRFSLALALVSNIGVLPTAQSELDASLYQPFKITAVEDEVGAEVYGSLSNAAGTPWCDGRPTIWTVGHQYYGDEVEKPHCQNPDGTWTYESNIETLDFEDVHSIPTGWRRIDRHDCEALDVNGDGLKDIICVVGANFHTDFGHTELYITQPNGTIVKEIDNGMQKYPSMSTRQTTLLKDHNNKDLVFVATSGVSRADGLTNTHRMFRLDRTKTTGPMKYFDEVVGPWITEAPYIQIGDDSVAGDFNGDGIDDMIVYDWNNPTYMYLQDSNGVWTEQPLPALAQMSQWQKAKLAYLTGNTRPDLIVSYGSFSGIPKHTVFIFEPIDDPPYFQFKFPYFQQRLKAASIGVEVFDVDHNGLPDFYVAVQYTAGWCNKNPGEVPPLDHSEDLIFVGQEVNGKRTWEKVRMEHKLRGCGGMVEKFGNNHTLMLAEGSREHHGYSYLLEWAGPP